MNVDSAIAAVINADKDASEQIRKLQVQLDNLQSDGDEQKNKLWDEYQKTADEKYQNLEAKLASELAEFKIKQQETSTNKLQNLINLFEANETKWLDEVFHKVIE